MPHIYVLYIYKLFSCVGDYTKHWKCGKKPAKDFIAIIPILNPMARHFLANLSFLVLLNFIIKPVYIFGIEVAVQNRVGAVSYGLYFAILNSGYLLQIINDFGLQIYNNRKVALDPGHIAATFRSILRLKFLLAVAFIAILGGLSYLLGYTVSLELVAVVSVNLILISLVLFLRSNISGLGFYKADSVLSVLDKGLMVLICGFILISLDDSFTIYHFVYAQMASLLITSLAAITILWRKGAFDGSLEPAGRIRELMRQAWPFALAVFLMTIYTRIDAIMIEQMLPDGAYQSGLYAAGYRLLDASNMVAYLYAVLLLPMFTRTLGSRDDSLALMRQAGRFMWVMTVSIALIAAAFRSDIMTFLYAEANETWADNFGLLILSFIPVGLMFVFGTYLTAVGDMSKLNILYASCVILNIVLNYVLIPRQGAIGAASATLATQTVVTISLMIMSLRHLKASPPGDLLLRTTGFTIISLSIVIITHTYAPFHWAICIAVDATLIGGLAFVTRMITRNDLESIYAR